jgi:hypothetical protein
MRSKPGSIDGWSNDRLYYVGVLLPYAAVPVGLYLLRSAWAAALAYELGMLAFVLAAPRRPCRPAPELRPAPRWMPGVLLAFSLLAGPAAVGLWPLAGRGAPGGLAATLAGWGVKQAVWPWLAAFLCLSTPWLEERHWRLWLGRSCRPAIETSAWFAGYHLLVLAPILRPAWLLLAFGSLALAAWCWHSLLRFRNGFGWAVFCHAVADASILAAASALMNP